MATFIVRYTLMESREIMVPAANRREAERIVTSGRAFDSLANPLFATDVWIETDFFQVDPEYTRERN